MTTALLTLLAFAPAAAQDWPQFRGPTGDGISKATGVPLRWSERDHVAWKTPLPGKGWSSPVVEEGKIWLTSAVEPKPTEKEKAELLEGVEARRLKATIHT